jgi:hypothetical protein
MDRPFPAPKELGDRCVGIALRIAKVRVALDLERRVDEEVPHVASPL